MCNRYRTKVDRRQYTDAFGVASEDTFEFWGTEREVYPKRPGFIIREFDGRRVISEALWGLIPRRAREPNPKFRPNNARAETFERTFPFSVVWKDRRCLIPVDSFFEYRHPETGRPQLHHFTPADGQPVAMAGFWDTWEGPDGPVETYTMLTTAASPFVAKIHNKGRRMPLILPPENYAAWLDTNCRDPAALRSLGYPDPDLTVSRV